MRLLLVLTRNQSAKVTARRAQHPGGNEQGLSQSACAEPRTRVCERSTASPHPLSAHTSRPLPCPLKARPGLRQALVLAQAALHIKSSAS